MRPTTAPPPPPPDCYGVPCRHNDPAGVSSDHSVKSTASGPGFRARSRLLRSRFSDRRAKRKRNTRIAATPDPTFNPYVESGSDHPYRELRESVERRLERERRFGGWFPPDPSYRSDGLLPDRIGFPLLVGFIWFWCSWMSYFGVWAFFFGGHEPGPWPLKMYLGIPVAVGFGGLVTFVVFRGVRVPWRRE
jgi:hypothetical protein